MGIHGLAELLEDARSGAVRLSLKHTRALKAEFALEPPLFDAVAAGDIGRVRFLLDSGIHPDHMNSFTRFRAMGTACLCGHLEVAKLLRNHGARLVAFYEDEPAPNVPSDVLVDRAAPWADDVRAWLRSRPPRGDQQRPSAALARSQPRKIVAAVAAWHLARHAHRREEARENAPVYWRRLRAHFAARPIAMYWLEQTQMRLCAAGGAGRAADAAAFEADIRAN